MDWALDNFPELKSPFNNSQREGDISYPVSDLMILLSSGPRHEEARLHYAKEILAVAHEDQRCSLDEDGRQHSCAFYSMAQQKTELLHEILEYEKTW